MLVDSSSLGSVVAQLARGEVIAYPTEAVWGLGCDPHNEKAIHQLLALKQRPPEKGLILIGATLEHFESILRQLDREDYDKVVSAWPGPVTWVLPHHGVVSDHITGGRETVAIRVTAHPLAAGICKAFGGCIVSTSANPTGAEPARSCQQVVEYFGNTVTIVDGQLGGLARPTKIYTLQGGTLRE